MSQQSILLGQNQFQIVDLQQSLDESQILQLLDASKQQEYLQINCKLNETKSNLVIQELKNLTQQIGLSFSFDQQSISLYNTLIQLVQNLSIHQNLQYLQVCFKVSKNLSFIDFGKNIQLLQNLQSFSFNIQDASYLGIKGSKEISKGLSQLKILMNLEFILQFNNENDDTEVIVELFKCFKFLNKLKCLSINLKQNSNIGDSGLYQISKHLESLINLKTLNLQIEYKNKISEKGLEFLSDSIQKLKNLCEVKIDISNCYINKQSIFNLVEGILQLENLIDLDVMIKLNIYKYQYTKRQKQLTTDFLFENKIKKLNTRIQRLSFYLYNYYMGYSYPYETSLKNIIKFDLRKCYANLSFEQTQNNLIDFTLVKQIRELQLSFQYIDETEDKLTIIQKISSFTQLEKLELLIQFNDHKSTREKYIIQDCFEQLQNLKYLKIVQLVKQKAKEALYYFADTIQQLKQLNKLDLQIIFNKDEDITNLFCQSIQQLKYLNSFKLVQNMSSFYYSMSSSSISILQSLISLNNLNELILNVKLFDYEQSKYYDECSHILQKLDSLRIINLKNANQYLQEFQLNYHSRFISSKYLRLVSII